MKTLIFLLFGFLAPLLGQDIFPLAQVRPGLKGEGSTVFRGTAVETFRFTVLGVLEHFAPGRSMIVVELESPQLEGGGILEGMSGSPVYVEGRMLGAVAYGFSFSRRPIAGVTPIEEMVRVATVSDAAGQGALPPGTGARISVPLPERFTWTEVELRQMQETMRDVLLARLRPLSAGRDNFRPLGWVMSGRGLSERALQPLQSVFGTARQVGGAARDPQWWRQGPRISMKGLAPAEAVAIPLIRGDFEYSASGTVTRVEGRKVFAFGHPFFNLGRVAWPMHRAEVITVVPSWESGFKMAATKEMVGSIVEDRFPAVYGILGRQPEMVPMQITLKGRPEPFRVELVDHPLLTPMLAGVTLSNVLGSERLGVGFQTLTARATLFIEGEDNVVLEDVYSGVNASDGFSNLVSAALYFLMNNREKAIRVQKVDATLDLEEILHGANLDEAVLDRFEYRPGELMTLSLRFQGDRAGSVSDTIQIPVPRLDEGTEFYLMVADSEQMSRFESKNVRSGFMPGTVGLLIRAINNLRKGNRLYVRLLTAQEGLFVQGHEYGSMPDSALNLFGYRAATNEQAEIRLSTLGEYQYPVPVTIRGAKTFRLKIRSR